MKSIITIPEGTLYLGKFLKDLPVNCLFDKGRVGAGGTTIALDNDENYVICVPFVSLIQNKIAQHSNVFGLYDKVKISDLKAYLSNDSIPVKKIMVTYDSLEKLMNYIDYTDYSLLIDELHLLFTQYSFRGDSAVTKVLENYSKFKKFCFMTATILEDDFILTELRHLPTVTAEWSDVVEVTVNSIKCTQSVVPTVVSEIKKFLNGIEEGNAYFFVNSVEFMKEVIKICGLTDENTRAIYSLNNKTNVGLKRSTTAPEDNKKINFLSSTVFEGCDLKDIDGKIYIVSDKSKSHTLIDISTSFQQIAGRIRDSKYINTITHIYTNTRYDLNVSYEEYKKKTEEGILEAYEYEKELNGLSDKLRNMTSVPIEAYISKKKGTNQFKFDENLVRIDLYNFKVTKCLYKLRVNLREDYQKYGYTVNQMDTTVKGTFHFPNGLKETIELLKDNPKLEQWAFGKYEFLEDAIKLLGYEAIEKCGYNGTNIKRKLNQLAQIPEKEKIYKEVNSQAKLQEGLFISAADAKKVFAKIYKMYGSKKVAKGTDIKDYFQVREETPRINKIPVKGFHIIRKNII